MSKTIRGTALYCGLDIPLDDMLRHLEAAARCGINGVFTSLQLPESKKEAVLHDLPILSAAAHQLGIQMDADVGPRAAEMFGLDLHSIASFKRLGIDVMRLDYGYTIEETAKLSNDNSGMLLELNASEADEEYLDKLDKAGANHAVIRFCHNFYPMPYTGMKAEKIKNLNDLIHRHGFQVGGFIAAQTHHRLHTGDGLPTIETMRNREAFSAAQEAMMLGFDNIFFGDDMAEEGELKLLAAAQSGPVTLRMEPLAENAIIEWLLNRELEQLQCGLDAFVRSASFGRGYPGDCNFTPSFPRHPGDVTICKSGFSRYAGEINLVHVELPADQRVGLLGCIIPEDLPLLEAFRGSQHFKLIRPFTR